MGVRQKDLAIEAGVDAPSICAFEKGRKIGPGKPLVSAICQALNLETKDALHLQRAARHDRSIKYLSDEFSANAVEFIGACISAAEELAPDELAGLKQEVDRLVRSKKRLLQLTSTKAPHIQRSKETQMHE